jgi:6-phosphogluconolactonase
MAPPLTKIFDDRRQMADACAAWLVERIAQTQGRFAIALSGGSTPKPLYALLATPGIARQIPWDRVHVFWGDERFVPADHPDNNARMARETLLSHVPIPAANVHAMPTDGEPEAAAAAYQRTLQDYYGAATLDPARPLFDVNLLGMGDDGHTASLFPGAPQLDEASAWVVAVRDQKPETRITLTYPALASARTVLFMVEGAAKQSTLTRVFAGDRALPAARVHVDGELVWYLDKSAAPVEGRRGEEQREEGHRAEGRREEGRPGE